MNAVGGAYAPNVRATRSSTGEAARERPLTHVAWFAGGAILAFLVPFLFSSLLKLQHDWYYLIYFAFVGIFLGVYVAKNGVDLGAVIRRGWRLSLILGVVATAAVVFNVLKNEPATSHPSGSYFAFEVLWRGVAYGIVDALLLSAFPGLVAFAMLKGDLQGIKQRASFAALAFALTLIITATYHLGYSQFREAGVNKPEVGNTLISVPTFVTANPLGSVVAHASMHVTATVHSYETPVFLPPQTSVAP